MNAAPKLAMEVISNAIAFVGKQVDLVHPPMTVFPDGILPAAHGHVPPGIQEMELMMIHTYVNINVTTHAKTKPLN